MKIEELKLGDWVMFEYTPVQIKAIHGDNEVDIAKDDEIAKVDIRTLEPIPLTGEILKKNGWIESIFGDFLDANHHLALCEVSRGYSIYKLVNEHTVWLTTIQYLHQLQHILWALGINDDLKI